MVVGTACGAEPTGTGGTPGSGLRLELLTDALNQPLHVTAAPNDQERLFVVEQAGRIRILKASVLLSTPFLDISGRISCCGERGLLGLAFDPAHSQNGRFYVDYTDAAGDTRVSRFTLGASADIGDATSEQLIIGVQQPLSNHNGGLIEFGPDGYLYVGLGDGGPGRNGQDLSTLLGSILRIAVSAGGGYTVPPDNPFVGHPTARAEIWAYGLRNPWRFAFDRATGDLYIGDVGEGRREEVDLLPAGSPAGVNFGWNTMEGNECFASTSCDRTGLTLPVLDYDHGEGCSIIGGHVYRGSAVPNLRGTYFYADYCGGWIRSFRYQGAQATELMDWSGVLDPGGNVTSFGEDAAGELYVTTRSGRLYRITPASN